MNIGILSSHNGSGYQTIVKAINEGQLNACVKVVISNNSDAQVLHTAKENNTAHFAVNNKLFPHENLDEKITSLMVEHEVDIIFLSGYMKKIETALLKAFDHKIINSHPALLPNFGGKGMYGRKVHEAVIEAKAVQSGVTVHYVNEHYDEGKYILQKELTLLENENVESLENRIKHLESIAIIEALQKII